MSIKYTSKGTALQKSISSVFTVIAALDTINYPDETVETVDISDLGSGVGKVKGATGYTDGGQASGSGFYDPADTGHKSLNASLAAPPTAADQWKINNPDAGPTAVTFSGWLTKFTPKASVGSFLKFDWQIDLTGVATYP